MHYFDNNEELKAIYSLSETHAPTLRIKTSLRFEKNLELQVSSEKTMNKENISFNCPVPIEDSIKNLINKVEEMPKGKFAVTVFIQVSKLFVLLK